MRSYADTTAYEEAFPKLDLLVVADIAMSETAALAHYVLPCKTAFESWEGDPGRGFSKVIARMRSPVLEAEGEQKENAEIFTLLADAMGLIPPFQNRFYQAAGSGSLKEYGQKLGDYMMASPESGKALPIYHRQNAGQGPGLGSSGQYLPLVYAIIPKSARKRQPGQVFLQDRTRACPLYQAIMSHPEGILIGIRDPEKNLEVNIATKNKKIQLSNPEVVDWIKKINPVDEEDQLKPDRISP